MTRLACATLAALVLSCPAYPAEEKVSEIEVKLPADAKFYIAGQPTNETGELRRFVSPKLPAGQTFTYEFRVEYLDGGDVVTRKRSVEFKPGEPIRVDFSDNTDKVITVKKRLLELRASLRTAEAQDERNRAENERTVEARKRSLREREALADKQFAKAIFIQSLVESDKRDLYAGLKPTTAADIWRAYILTAEKELVELETRK
jgi:uncharacterized protein (TIGR03000 family)